MKCSLCKKSNISYPLSEYPSKGKMVKVHRCLRCGGNFTTVNSLKEINGKK